MSGRLARRITVLLVIALLTAACGSGGSSSTPTTPTSPSGSAASMGPSSGVLDVSLSRLTAVRAIQRTEATILIGFDAAAVAAMVVAPPSLDFATQALLCLHAGERPTGGWSLAIQSISLEGPAMRVLASEVEPPPGVGVTEGFTYPADCAVIDRTVLPIGQLTVRADDTTSDAFIVDAVVQVPAR